MYDRPRNWKWMVPAALVAPCVWWWNDWLMSGGEWTDLAIIPLVLSLILGVAAVVNLVLYIYHYWADMYAEVRKTLNMTPEVLMFQAAKGMHPEAVKALLVHRRTVWEMEYVPVKDLVDWTYKSAPNVHAGFVDFFLDHSNQTAVMSKRLLSDGSKGFDPEGQVTDYEQYDALILLMQQKLMITQAYGNQAPQWMPPYTPDLARHRFGLDGALDADPERMSDALLAVVRAQTKDRDGGAGSRSNGGGASSALRSAQHDVISEALEDLEQTAEMKAKTSRLFS